MKKYLFLLLLLTVSCSSPVLVDTFGNISGTVQDARAVAPLAGVKVALTPTGYSQVTGLDGSFQFDNLDVQEYTLTFTKDGFQPLQQKVTVKPGLSSSVQVSMTPTEGSLMVSPSSLDFGTTTTSLQLQLRNKATADINYTVQTSGSWISVSTTVGTVKQSEYMTVLVSRSGLSPGKYSGEVMFRYSGESLSVPVAMEVPASETPVVTVEKVVEVINNAATIQANLVSVGTSAVTQMGICWSSSNQSPTLSDDFSNQGDATSACSFKATLTGLQSATTYYCRAYARNSSGVSYSNTSLSFTTTAGSGGGGTSDPAQIAVRQGLMAYYTFDESDISDKTDMELHGQTVGDPSFLSDTPSGKGKSLFLNGSKEQYVLINYNLFKGHSHFSISLWLKDFSTGAAVSGIYAGMYNNNGFQYYPRLYFTSEGKVSFTCYSYGLSSAPVFFYSYSPIQSDTWHLVTVTCANGELKLYIDGVLIDTVNSDYSDPKDNTPKVHLGGNGNGIFPVYFTGKMDNVRIYSRAIEPEDVMNIYEAEK